MKDDAYKNSLRLVILFVIRGHSQKWVTLVLPLILLKQPFDCPGTDVVYIGLAWLTQSRSRFS